MGKIYTALGLMSGTSMDGVDVSIIQSDGITKYKAVFDKYFEFEEDLHQQIINIKSKVNMSNDIKNFKKELNSLERKITLFHAEVVNKVINESGLEIDFIGFHGQTIFHNVDEKITKQLGDGKLLSQLTKKKVIYDFRQNDLKNDGQGAPLTPIFHQMLATKFKLKKVCFINIGGILNYTIISDDKKMFASDIGPGMCLIDQWIRKKSKNRYDFDGIIGKSGKINKIILNQALENFYDSSIYQKKISRSIMTFDINDFNISFVKGLSLEDGAATLIEYTAQIIKNMFNKNLNFNKNDEIIFSGGGRKNNFLIERIKMNKINIKLIDEYKINGDFIESQAFGYLAIRSYLKLPITFPSTTGCKKACTGGILVENF